MFFSVITPANSQLRAASDDLASTSYAEHQWLWKFFPSGAHQIRDFIFRRYGRDEEAKFYVVSHRPPVTVSDVWHVQSRDYDPQLGEGQTFSFELRANPVVTKKNAAGKSVRRDVVMDAKKRMLASRGLPLETKWAAWNDTHDKPVLNEIVQEQCADWLHGVAKRNGFQIGSAEDNDPLAELRIDAYGQAKIRKQDQVITISTVDFSGYLRVTDPALLKPALFNGVGHAKAFGCGLLLVRRVP